MTELQKNVVGSNLTILLFGPTGSGKTAQIGELAEYLIKSQKKRTRLYSADRGGWETIKPYTEIEIAPGKPIIEAVSLTGDPFVWINHVVKGEKLVNGNWAPGIDPDIGLYAFEGMTSMADAEMSWMAEASGRGVNIGGGGSFSFNAGAGKDTLKIGSNNMAHYAVAQQQVFEKSTQSQFLPGIVLWTAGDRRGEDDANGGVVGPQTAGKAQAAEVPRWFKYTFRMAVEVLPGQPPKHVLYTDRHVELQARGTAQGIANSRIPLAGTKVDIPSRIEPASLVYVLQLIEQRQAAAKDDIKARLGL